jgi:hypothetical protein
MKEHESKQSRGELAEFEQHLSGALRRVDPPSGFAERVIHRVVATPRTPSLFGLHFGWAGRRAVAMAAVALLVLAVWTAYGVHERREQARAARAESQFETAIAVTGRTLERVRLRLDGPGLLQRLSSASQGTVQK